MDFIINTRMDLPGKPSSKTKFISQVYNELQNSDPVSTLELEIKKNRGKFYRTTKLNIHFEYIKYELSNKTDKKENEPLWVYACR